MSISEQDAVAGLRPARRTVVPSRDRIRESGREAPGAVCHALGARITGPVRADARDALAARFSARAAELVPAGPAAGVFREATTPWTQAVPCRSDSSDAERWRTRELTRPLVAHRDPAVRGVLLTYTDGVTELVVVAHRAALGATGLRRFTAEVIGTAPGTGDAAPGTGDAAPVTAAQAPAAPDPAAQAAVLADCVYDDRPDWGLGRPDGPDTPQTRALPLPAGHPVGDTESWTAALGIVLARYEGSTRPLVPALVTDTADPRAVEGIALIPVEAGPASTLGTVDKSVRTALAAGPAWHTEDLRRARAATGGDAEAAVPAVGVVAVGHGPAAVPGTDRSAYLPFQRAPFPVTLSVVRDAGGELLLRCDHSPRLLHGDIADRLLGHVSRVHRALTESPDTPVADVALLDEAELAATAELGRPAGLPSFDPERIDAAVAAIAASRPDAVAVSYGSTRLTYRELDSRADRLAHALRGLGVADGDRVGVCLDRSAELVVTLLAVLKAGATYVPMDPAYPLERLSYTTADAELAVVVTDRADFPGGTARVIGTAETAELTPGTCDGPPSSSTGPHDPAYVIYTSGSTGRPKGVVIPHVNVLSLMAATLEDFALGSDDVWTLFHSSAFDFSVWEIWGCLLTGGRLVVVPYWVSRSPEDFHRLLVQERVSVLSQTPSAFAHLMDVERDVAEPVPVRLVVFGGEGLEPRMLLPWFDRHPESACRVVNMYGITETTVHVTAQTVTRAEALTGSKSVGHALPGWWVRVADPEGRPLPVGAAGEIYVGGAGVAAHYLNRPDLDGQRFLTDARTGERMYRSGDKGRLLPDGRLEHLGRLDNQVKLRGFRIELDEIRAVLLDDPQVGAAAVVLNRTDPDDPATAQLDAYVVLEGDDTAGVRQRAARYLPEYMVPSTVTSLDRMPLTPNGKLDAHKLPRPAPASAPASAPVTTGAAAAPEDAFTADLLEVWQEVLGVPVGPDDNFFDLGGNSLLAMRVGAALRRRGGTTVVAMRDLYLSPTIRQLAAGRAG
ncbi:amino acid adenylation domain-containing protein [Streptomyces sp. NBC_01102]|uniref:amino acid adenylation domain-containing protein n=1 Tax=Streptomyces sp. NBC_01102 TaxID=2903749 RepID=UPI0038634991|nr:amino acid adenylation domain-containing protein [Streptomyces sp. NBC_01102]